MFLNVSLQKKVALCQSLGWDQFRRDRKHLKIKISLVAEGLGNKPSPEQPCADCAAHFRARRLDAAAKKLVSNMSQARDPLKPVKFYISPCSRVGHRFKAITSWQIVGTQSRDVELSRNGQAE